MASSTPSICEFGWKAPQFELPDGEGNIYQSENLQGPNGMLVMFICNHCPYVRSITNRLVPDVLELQMAGIGVVAISANDADQYPEDRPEEMVKFAQQNEFSFPYLYDETQEIARAYEAVCTPDFFGFNADMELHYRGRLDEGRTSQPPKDAKRELRDAMLKIAKTGTGPHHQHPSVGCSIKWK